MCATNRDRNQKPKGVANMTTREKRLPRRDKKRLAKSIRQARSRWSTYAPFLDAFQAQIDESPSVPLMEVSDDTVLLNTPFTLMDLSSGETERYTLVYPEDQTPNKGSVSVLSPMGMAAIGARPGDEIHWHDAVGPRRARVLRVGQRPDAD
jgi:regulator of nucleoside diphosphate kinase